MDLKKRKPQQISAYFKAYYGYSSILKKVKWRTDFEFSEKVM